MKHSTTYPFRRWYRKPLTPRESAVIGLLERRRRRTGRVSIVLTVSAAEQAAISRLLLHYALFLNNRCSLSCTIRIAAVGTTPNSSLPTPNCTQRQQVLEEDVSVVNPMISSALRCVHGVRGSPLHGGCIKIKFLRHPPFFKPPENPMIWKQSIFGELSKIFDSEG